MPQGESSAADELLATFGNEAVAYRRLRALTVRERQALQRGNLVDLASVVLEKESLMRSLTQHEVTRTHLVATLAEMLGLPADSSLQHLIPHLDETNALKLRTTYQECITLVEELRTLNRGNYGLIKTRLDRIEATLDFLSRTAVESDGHYTVHGDNRTLVHTGHVLNWQA